MAKLHDAYKTWCQGSKHNFFSIAKFHEYFHENNFSLFKRKKDNCNTCTSYEAGNTSQTEFNMHQKRKNDALNMKEEDKKWADNVSKFVITADTESLLIAPHNDSSMMFFHSKLNVHNFTFFDLKTRQVMNYVWLEVNGDLEASNFTSCYINYE